jgi:hypothetical protein
LAGIEPVVHYRLPFISSISASPVVRYLNSEALPTSEQIQRSLNFSHSTEKPGARIEFPLSLDSVATLAALLSPLPLRFASVLLAAPVASPHPHQPWHADDSEDANAMRAIVYLTDVLSNDAGAIELKTTAGSVAFIGPAGTVSTRLGGNDGVGVGSGQRFAAQQIIFAFARLL